MSKEKTDFIYDKITNIGEALRYVVLLHENQLIYHFDDDAFDVVFGPDDDLTDTDKAHLNLRAEELFYYAGSEHIFEWFTMLVEGTTIDNI